ncbi:hypothetical protein [Nocardia seriolae]|uniref:hypothetical protein n=1 Tax=Nocardia seriolae TaxID=37332 RepID=UPI001319E11A|nr:hypothetical protein [Nocardia seriolae]
MSSAVPVAPNIAPPSPASPVPDREPVQQDRRSGFDGRIPFLVIAAAAAFVAGASRTVSGRPSWIDWLLRRADDEIKKPTGPNVPPPNPDDPTYQFWLNASEHQRAFWEALDHSPFGMQIHHLIEQQIFRDYPGVFDEDEKNAIENLRGIWQSVANDVHLRQIRRAWNQIYGALKKAGILPWTGQPMSGPEAEVLRQQLLFWAVVVDILFGDWMTPRPTILDDPDFDDILKALGLSPEQIAKFKDLTPAQRQALLKIILDMLSGKLRDYRDYFPNAELSAPWERPQNDPGQQQQYPVSPGGNGNVAPETPTTPPSEMPPTPPAEIPPSQTPGTEGPTRHEPPSTPSTPPSTPPSTTPSTPSTPPSTMPSTPSTPSTPAPSTPPSTPPSTTSPAPTTPTQPPTTGPTPQPPRTAPPTSPPTTQPPTTNEPPRTATPPPTPPQKPGEPWVLPFPKPPSTPWRVPGPLPLPPLLPIPVANHEPPAAASAEAEIDDLPEETP